MKDQVEMDHLIKSDAFTLNSGRAMDLASKSITNVSNFLTASPKNHTNS